MMRCSIKKLVNKTVSNFVEVFSLTPDLRSEIVQCGRGYANWPSMNSFPPPWGLVDRYFLVFFP